MPTNQLVKSRTSSFHDIYTGEFIEGKLGFLGHLKYLDIFGLPVQLTHKGNRKFRTYTGLTFSIIIGIVVISFFSNKIATLYS